MRKGAGIPFLTVGRMLDPHPAQDRGPEVVLKLPWPRKTSADWTLWLAGAALPPASIWPPCSSEALCAKVHASPLSQVPW